MSEFAGPAQANGKSDQVWLQRDALRCEALRACEKERFYWLVFPMACGRRVAWRDAPLGKAYQAQAGLTGAYCM